MTSILPWIAGAWMLAIMFVFALLGMSSKQDRVGNRTVSSIERAA